ncbi:MAG: maleylpyruvate isomerase family mycothiol-dependent enzyme [Actinomycetota bacterium]|nr:maleylpyruvate isomerase family mycothiol-dependent enzyme [Actinomycetota bacterium]
MPDDAYWQLMAQQRHDLATFLEDLTPQQWDAPSLCSAWRVRDVAAHLALTPQVSRGRMFRAALRAGGNPHRVAAETAIRHASRPTEEILREIHEHAERRDLPWPLDGRNVLFDLLVHTQDMLRPLGVDRPMPTEAARMALDRVWEIGWPFRARRRLHGVGLRATDTDWTAGDGPEVAGRTEDLLLLATGRTEAATERLSGPGVGALVSR